VLDCWEASEGEVCAGVCAKAALAHTNPPTIAISPAAR